MIREEEVVKIGNFIKTHGVKGELSLLLQNDIFDTVDPEYIICRMDGILVPFFIEDYRFKGEDSLFLKLEDIDDDNSASQFVKMDVYVDKRQLDSKAIAHDDINHYSWSTFIGFTIIDEEDSIVGKIIDIDESTMNTLFLVEYNEEEVMIPIQEELIVWVDENLKKIKVQIPPGLLSLD